MEFIQEIGFAVCHQLPERSIFIDGKQLPVCARDTGIYIGSIIALFFILLSRRRKSNTIPVSYISFTFVFFMIIMAVDGLTSYLGLRSTTNEIRLLSGLLVGISLPFFLYPLLIDNFFESKKEMPVLSIWYELALLLLLVGSLYAIIIHYNTGLFYPVSFLTTAGILILHFLMFATFFSFIVSYMHITNYVKKSLLIFPICVIMVIVEFSVLAKLHHLLNA